MADQILVTYKTDISQTEKALADVQKELILTEEIGEQTFDNIGKSAGGAATNVGKAADNMQKMAGASKNLQNSVNQLSRELPAFTMNLNTGFLAISNNLPYLFDGLREVREQNKLLAAEGKQTTSVLKALAGAVFSWQTALSIGITLLTVYGGKLVELVTGYKDNTKALKEAADAEKKYQEELKRTQKSLEDRTQALKNQLAAQREGKIVDEIELRNKKALLEQMKSELLLLQLLTKNGAIQVQGNSELTHQLYLEYEARVKRAQLLSKEVPALQLEVDALEKQVPLIKQIAAEKEAEAEARRKAQEAAEKEAKWLKDYTERALKAVNEESARQTLTQSQFFTTYQKINEESKKSEVDKWIEEEERRLKEQLKIDKEWEKYDKEIRKYEEDKAQKEIELEQATVNSLLSIQYSLFALGASNQSEFAIFQKGLTFTQIGIDTASSISAIIRAATTSSLTPLQALASITSGIAGVLANVARAKSLIEGTTIPPLPPLQLPQQTENKFADGVIDLRGAGTETSDSIPAWLSKGESVIKAKSTRMFKDELYAINSNPLDYQKLIEQKYIIPAIEKERERQVSFAENIARSIALHSNFNDERIVKTLKENKPATSKDIAILADVIEKKNRLEKFRGKLIKSK